MKVRCWAEFTTDLPDDCIEDEEEIIRYGGENVAEAVAGILRNLGCEVKPPIYADEHGWALDAQRGDRRFWGQITQIEGYLFEFDDPHWIPKMFGRQHPVYLDMLRRLGDALAQDSRFHNVRWYFDSEVLSGSEGAMRPLDD